MRKIKRLSIALLAVCIALIGLCGFDSQQQKVYDYAGLLSEDQIETLTEEILLNDDYYGLDIVMVTTNDAEGMTSQEYATNFYTNGGFGYDEKDSGMLFLIDMDNRQAYIATKGKALEEINDTEIEVILDDVFKYLPYGDYYNSCEAFLMEAIECFNSSAYDNISVDEYNSGAKPSEDWLSGVFPSNRPNSFVHVFRNPFISIAVAAGISLVIVLIISFRHKPKMTADGSTYINDGSFKMLGRSDIFVGRTTTTRHIDNGSGGHGGSHGGSSHGGGFGGGGRSF